MDHLPGSGSASGTRGTDSVPYVANRLTPARHARGNEEEEHRIQTQRAGCLTGRSYGMAARNEPSCSGKCTSISHASIGDDVRWLRCIALMLSPPLMAAQHAGN